jgi:hypothetical protein
MPIQLDHLIVPSRDPKRAAKLLASVLGVPWQEDSMGLFSAVHVNDGLTIDFGNSDGFDVHHY